MLLITSYVVVILLLLLVRLMVRRRKMTMKLKLLTMTTITSMLIIERQLHTNRVYVNVQIHNWKQWTTYLLVDANVNTIKWWKAHTMFLRVDIKYNNDTVFGIKPKTPSFTVDAETNALKPTNKCTVYR